MVIGKLSDDKRNYLHKINQNSLLLFNHTNNIAYRFVPETKNLSKKYSNNFTVSNCLRLIKSKNRM